MTVAQQFRAPLRLLCPADNLLCADATTISSANANQISERILLAARRRTGQGVLALAGQYVGDDHVTVEALIAGLGGGTPLIGALAGTVANDQLVASQPRVIAGQPPSGEYRLTLTEAGFASARARLAIGDVGLEALAAGATNICVRVKEDAIRAQKIAANQIGQVPQAISAGTGFVNTFNIGAAPLLNAEGQVPVSAPRISFANHATVYRLYRRIVEGVTEYAFSPALKVDVEAGEAVYRITATYTVELYDGDSAAIFETHAGVVTPYDLMQAVGSSAVVRPFGTVVIDRTPLGQSTVDLNALLSTTAFLRSVTSTGTDNAKNNPPTNIVLAADAATQIITVEMIEGLVAANGFSVDRWRVNTVSGQFEARSGVAFSSPDVAFTIPSLAAVDGGRDGLVISRIEYAAREEGELRPRICLLNACLGSNAEAGEFCLVYTERAEAGEGDVGAGCDAVGFESTLDESCIDCSFDDVLTQTGGGELITDSDLKSRVQSLTSWSAGACLANLFEFDTGATAADTPTQSNIFFANPPAPTDADLRLTALIQGVLYSGLNSIITQTDFGSAERNDGLTCWDAAFANVLSVFNYTLGGASSAGPNTTPPIQLWYPGMALVGNASLVLATVFDTGSPVSANFPSSQGRQGYVEASSNPGVWIPTGTNPAVNADHGDAPPAFTGTATFTDSYGDEWAYAGQLLDLYPGYVDPQNLTTPGAVTNIEAASRILLERLPAINLCLIMEMNKCRAAACLNPFDSASSGSVGDGCWRDTGDSHIWLFEGEELSRRGVFTGVEYAGSAPDPADPNNAAASILLNDYRFTIWVDPEFRASLKPGDKVCLTANRAVSPYAVGDKHALESVGGDQNCLLGGEDGNDQCTWRATYPNGVTEDFAIPLSGPQELIMTPVAGQQLAMTLNNSGRCVAGDTLLWCLQAYQMMYRENGGAWQGPQDVPAPDGGGFVLPTALDLRIESETGGCDLFNPGDYWKWCVEQPSRPANLCTPLGSGWTLSGDVLVAEMDLGSAQSADAIALWLPREVPPGVTVIYDAGTTAAVGDISLPLTLNAAGEVSVLPFPAGAHSYQFHRLTIANLGASARTLLGWVWLGEMAQLLNPVARFSRVYRAQMVQGSALNGKRRYRGTGKGGTIEWDALLQGRDVLLDCWQTSKERCDEPVGLVPNVAFPDSAMLARFANEIRSDDLLNYADSCNNTMERLTLDFEPFYY